MKILIADDESEIRSILRILLEDKKYDVREAADGKSAVAMVQDDPNFDLVIMDVMMPKLSGTQATRSIREFSDVPILFLTAKSMDRDKANAYTAGGDDYLVKPFAPKELLLKVEALTRRYTAYRAKTVNRADGILTLPGGVTLDPAKREVAKNGVPVDIRDKEWDVLLYLARHRKTVVNPQELYREVWEEMPLPSSGNTVTVHILNLRRKLEDVPSSPKIIRTVWGRGYQID